MESIPTEWVDKIFNCMNLFYGDRWTSFFNEPHLEEMHKAIWKCGLVGLKYEEIKAALVFCKASAFDHRHTIPHVMEFYRIAKGSFIPEHNRASGDDFKCDQEVQRKAMNEIRIKLGMKKYK